MKFFKWIESQGGPKEVARLLGTESPTVKAWINGRASPRPQLMIKLVKLGKGAFDYKDIVLETTRVKKVKTQDKEVRA